MATFLAFPKNERKVDVAPRAACPRHMSPGIELDAPALRGLLTDVDPVDFDACIIDVLGHGITHDDNDARHTRVGFLEPSAAIRGDFGWALLRSALGECGPSFTKMPLVT